MLTVPQEIKDLLHQDTCRKNIRIQFPNGERTDICNGLIVKDSVKFTESLCSQDTLKFGLCESPVFECETVGVGNIKGATITVFCEIYCDLTVSGAVFRPDLGAYVYPIPYGTFVVDSCKRQADMIHRKILAYSGITVQNSFTTRSYCAYDYTYGGYGFYKVKSSDAERIKDYVFVESGASFTYDPMRRLCARLNAPVFEDITLSAFPSGTAGVGTIDGRNEYYRSTKPYLRYSYKSCKQSETDLLFVKFNNINWNFDQIYNEYMGYVRDVIDAGWLLEEEYSDIDNGIRQWIYDFYSRDSMFALPLGPFVNYRAADKNNVSTNYITKMGEEAWVYPKNTIGNSTYDDNRVVWFGAPTRVGIEYGPINNRSYKYVDLGVSYDFEVQTASSSWFDFTSMVQKRIPDTDSNNKSGYRLDGSCDNAFYQKLLDSVFELQGLFARVNRINEIDTLNIKQHFDLTPDSTLYPGTNTYPEGLIGGKLLPNDYQSCWYDDEYTKPFGAVSCEYKNTQNTDCVYVLYLAGFDDTTDTNTYKTYYLDGNSIIGNSTWTQAQIESICIAIADNIEGVTYMPVEFTGRGLPYVEAGDTFEILTKSNDSITTIVLNRTLSGEQTLTDSYKSV